MQLQNASVPGYGSIQQLSDNATWVYPFLPGEPPGIVRLETFAGCIPSNVTIAETCCSAVNGSFILQHMNNTRQVNQTEMDQIWSERHPDTSAPNYGTSYRVGDIVTTPNSTQRDMFNWCMMDYEPSSSTPMNGSGFSSGPNMGNIPESVNSWLQCFQDNIPEGAIERAEAAWVCAALPLHPGGGGMIGSFASGGGPQKASPPSSGSTRSGGQDGVQTMKNKVIILASILLGSMFVLC